MSNEAAGTFLGRDSDFHSFAIVSLYEMESSGDRPEGGRFFPTGTSAMNAENLSKRFRLRPIRAISRRTSQLKTRSIPRLSSTGGEDMT